MRHFALAVLTSAVVVFFGTQAIYSMKCIRVCDEKRTLIFCNQSLILISDTTNLLLEKQPVALENMKRDCMGKMSCDPSRACSLENGQALVVHYLCVNESDIVPRRCNIAVEPIRTSFGYIQSPEYPAAVSTSSPCKWEITALRDSVVVLSLFDLVARNNYEICERGLVVKGRRCERETNGISFCARENKTSLTICGKVQIELQATYIQRFWMSFQVFHKGQEPKFPVLQCAATERESKYNEEGIMDTGASANAGDNSQDSNTEVLVIMLSIISGISAVLLIILIVVCVRCRLLQASHAELMHSDPSPSGQAHYEYVSSSDTEKTRPHLAEGYFEVADAVPFTQRVETSISPAYAEVEQHGQLKKVLQPSASEQCLKQCKSLKEETQTGNIMSLDNSWPKRAISGRLKGDRNKHCDRKKHDVANRNTDLKTLPASANNTRLQTSAINKDDVCSNYEPVGKYSFNKFYSNLEHEQHVQGSHLQSASAVPRLISTSEVCGKKLDVVQKNIKTYPDTPSSAHSVYHFPDVTSVMNTAKNMTCLSVDNSSNLSERSKTLPSKNFKASMQPQEMKNIDNKYAGPWDMPSASGIVRNGIRKFEKISI